MTTILSSPTTITVAALPVASGPAAVPYALPGPGQALAIAGTGGSVNSASGIRPSALDEFNWNYSLFNSYGGGSMVPGFSDAGAYVIAATGGHNAPENIGAAIFDFQTAKWSRKDPQGGAYHTGAPGYQISETSGSPWLELNGSGGVPAPAHLYSQASYIPKNGTFTKGAFLLVGRSYTAGDSLATTSACHAFDLATGVWSRYSDGTNRATAGIGPECSSIFDEARNRYWFVTRGQNAYNAVDYFDPVTKKWAKSGTFSYGLAAPEGGGTMLYQTYLIRRSMNGSSLSFFDPDNASAGWANLSVSDPGSALSSVSFYNKMAFFPPSNCFYGIGRSGGSTLVRVRPPSNSPRTNTWTVDKVTLTGSLPARTTLGGSDKEHYTGLVYVPGIDRLAWIPGGQAAVYLIHPGS